MKKLFCVSLLVFLTSGCDSVSPEEVLTADYGKRPTAEQYTSTVEMAIRRQLEGPGWAKFKFPYPAFKGYYEQGFEGPHFGYWTCGFVSSRKPQGGYTDFNYFVAVYNHGQVVYSNVSSQAEPFDLTSATCASQAEYLSRQPSEADVPLSLSSS